MKQISLPKCKVFPLSVQYEGFMPELKGENDANAYCYAWLFRKNKSKEITEVTGDTVFTETCQEVSELVGGGTNVCNTKVSFQFLALGAVNHKRM